MYRRKLDIPRKVIFGLELELDKVDPGEVYHLVRGRIGKDWIVKDDNSLTKDQSAEIVSPRLRNTEDTWELLFKLGELLNEINASYDKCSFQVNFDGSLLPSVEAKAKFLRLYAMYEDIIYRFSKSEDLSYRDSIEMYAAPIILAIKGMMPLGDNASVNIFRNQKRYGIAFKDQDKDLIEFRTPNMSNNPVYFQNYINTFYYLIMAVSKGKYDDDEVRDYIGRFSKSYLLEGYEVERVEKAKAFCKRIFPKDMDKSNFMSQYIGR